MNSQFRNPTATIMPWPLQSSRPRKFQRGHWELRPNNCCRYERTSSRLTQIHLGSHPGPSQGYGYPFNEILEPEFKVINSSGGINQQRHQHFSDMRFELLSSGRGQERHFGVKRKRDSSEEDRKRHRPYVPASVTQVRSIPVPHAQRNVTQLYERLVTAGPLLHGKADAGSKNKEEAISIKPVDFSQPEALKICQPGLVAQPHSGIPCSSCGVHFPAEEHMKYRQHLDWHFHQNRRLKYSGDHQSRGWYLSHVPVPADADSKNKEEDISIKPVDFGQPQTLKIRQPGLVAQLHSGISCSSCGVRFPAEERTKYRQHLDWHFRQNRHLKDSGDHQSRGWYLSVSDWIQFEEIEDPEDAPGPCWFELQRAANVADTEGEVVPSVSAGDNPDDEICTMCLEKFKNVFNDEEEEWQLLGAVRIDGKTFHPLCGEDYKKSVCSPAGAKPPPSDLEIKIAEKTEESTNGSSWSHLMPEMKIGVCPS